MFAWLRRALAALNARARGAEFWGRFVVTFGALAAYPELLTFSRIYVPDDGFTSDIFNGEMAGRALFGRILANGELPLWSNELGAGYPIGTGFLGDPLGSIVWAALPPATALCTYLLILLWIAAHGTYSLTKRFGAGPAGAAFAGIAYASSGYFASQLRHLSIIGTAAWIPLGLYLLDVALAKDERDDQPWANRVRTLAYFGLVVAMQALAGFPQTLHLSLLGYGIYAAILLVHRSYQEISIAKSSLLGVIAAVAVGLGAASGAVVLLPLRELADVSGRNEEFAWGWLHSLGYAPTHFANLFVPYVNGDASDGTFTGPGLFWEVYGYAGLATVLLALLGLFTRLLRVRVIAFVLMGAFFTSVVLGPESFMFEALWNLVPGLDQFRFWTRALVFVDLVLAVLGGYTLSSYFELPESEPRGRRLLGALSWVVVLVLVLDLAHYQRRQNPFISGAEWLAPPATVAFLKGEERRLRIHSIEHRPYHRLAYHDGPGWSRPEVFKPLLPTLAPNLPPLFGIATLDVYSGAAPSGYGALWSDHSRAMETGLSVRALMRSVVAPERYLELLRLYGVTHVISAVPVRAQGIGRPVLSGDSYYVYRLEGAARAHYLQRVQPFGDEVAAARALGNSNLDLKTWATYDITTALPSIQGTGEYAQLAVEDLSSTHVRIDVSKLEPGYVFLADTYFPGWTATLDGKPIPVARGNVQGRVVPLETRGKWLEFRFEPVVYSLAWPISVCALLSLVLVLLACRWWRRDRAALLAAPDESGAALETA